MSILECIVFAIVLNWIISNAKKQGALEERNNKDS